MRNCQSKTELFESSIFSAFPTTINPTSAGIRNTARWRKGDLNCGTIIASPHRTECSFPASIDIGCFAETHSAQKGGPAQNHHKKVSNTWLHPVNRGGFMDRAAFAGAFIRVLEISPPYFFNH
jgi:hypothetical protein